MENFIYCVCREIKKLIFQHALGNVRSHVSWNLNLSARFPSEAPISHLREIHFLMPNLMQADGVGERERDP